MLLHRMKCWNKNSGYLGKDFHAEGLRGHRLRGRNCLMGLGKSKEVQPSLRRVSRGKRNRLDQRSSWRQGIDFVGQYMDFCCAMRVIRGC